MLAPLLAMVASNNGAVMRSRSKWQGGRRRSRPRDEVILHEMITEVGGGRRSCHHGGCKGDLNRSMLLPRGEKEKVVALV